MSFCSEAKSVCDCCGGHVLYHDWCVGGTFGVIVIQCGIGVVQRARLRVASLNLGHVVSQRLKVEQNLLKEWAVLCIVLATANQQLLECFGRILPGIVRLRLEEATPNHKQNQVPLLHVGVRKLGRDELIDDDTK